MLMFKHNWKNIQMLVDKRRTSGQAFQMISCSMEKTKEQLVRPRLDLMMEKITSLI
jgi:hypothetical protein